MPLAGKCGKQIPINFGTGPRAPGWAGSHTQGTSVIFSQLPARNVSLHGRDQ